MSILYPQPAPLASDGDVWAEIIAELDATDPLRALAVERRAQGIERYGTPLQRDNGRDHLVDALQEAMDLWVYLRAAGLEGLSAPSGTRTTSQVAPRAAARRSSRSTYSPATACSMA